jgi:hypothetical protein
MKIKTPTEFLTFHDGQCNICEVKGNQLAGRKMTLDFGERTVGMKRLYTARAASSEINRLIQVPQMRSVTVKDNAVIGTTRYKIDAVQHLNDTNPPVTVLTLVWIGATI